jgi:hypothetical protein
VSVYCNGCRGFGAGPIGGPFEGAVLSFEDTDSDRGCRILTIAKTMNESSVMSVKSLDTLIIFCDPKVSVSSMNNSVEPAANTVNQRRLMEKAAMSCEKTATERGTKLVTKAPCRETCEWRLSVRVLMEEGALSGTTEAASTGRIVTWTHHE